MKKIAELLVDRRRTVFLLMMLLTLFCLAMIPRVRVNTDMTKYLPDSSSMKQGIDIMAQEFSDLSVPNTVRVMFHNLPEEEKESVLSTLKKTPHADSVAFLPGDERYEKDGYTLYILSFSVGFFSSVGGGSSRNVSLAFSSSYIYISAPGNINLLRICRQHCGYFLANSFSLFFSFESNV